MVRLSIRYGNAPHSAYGYVIYGMLHCAVPGNTNRGLAYGQLACRAAIELGAEDIEGRVLMVFAGFIQHWNAPLADTLPVFLKGADKAVSVGDLEYHGYTRYGHASYALMVGQPHGPDWDGVERMTDK
jgi:predicted ATPase